MTAARTPRPKPGRLSGFYDDGFYEQQVADSLKSARIYLSHLWQFVQPAAVLDVGCGRGTWLKACHDLGSVHLLGLDGDWNNQSLMIDDAIEFHTADLNRPFSIPRRVDLAMSLEVAEHLEQAAAAGFVESLANASDTILFSAACPQQGGTHHINEQPHSFWARLFHSNGFFPVDLFRPTFWGNDDVCFWYRQNTFLYLKHGSEAATRMTAEGMHKIANTSFMDCIHPELFREKLAQADGFRHVLTALIPSFGNAVRRRLPKIAAR